MVLPQATNYSLIIIHFSLFTKTNQQQVTANNYFKWWHAPCAEFYGFEKPLVLTPALTQPLSGERLASREKTYAYHSVIEPRGQKGKGEGGARGGNTIRGKSRWGGVSGFLSPFGVPPSERRAGKPFDFEDKVRV